VIFDQKILQELAVRMDVTGYLRIIEAKHRATPTGMGYGATRFSSPTDGFTLLYAARDLPTALAEKVIRDRFQGKKRRVLLEADIEEQVVASLVPKSPLTLLDLRTSGTTRLGVPTDAARGRAQQAGRKFSQQLYDGTNFDGIVYMSRITNAECVALYDRAVGRKLDPACPVVGLSRLSDLGAALTSLNIDLQG
jgi:RES domain-containing protein